ncbi:hypothetical protein A5791_22455 [Mycobacterium sp. 852002-51163_SCH5372311]|uniref:DUF4189 domain-containing protein n=1 Tax=Mycobacterium sp. 852002-51163_SCH5372311 TaxID=1834097 RepID=UPI0008011DCF|nr:DUF4189 domain-containing protein [Mycobacterium sp. 852002-51163_SCH5372311]OBF85579.1 hypothetical protein A5791_22455 [Mycobacterium sp. 852002-51163_SCH5372311]
MKRFVLAAAVGAGLSVGLACPANAAGNWAAIAYSPTADYSYTSYGPQSQSEAEQDALKNCSAKGNDCKILASSANCVALTDDGKSVHGGSGTTAQEAVNDALARSGSGAKVRASKCSTDP